MLAKASGAEIMVDLRGIGLCFGHGLLALVRCELRHDIGRTKREAATLRGQFGEVVGADL